MYMQQPYKKPVCLPIVYVLGDEMVTLYEDEFLAGFKPLNTAMRPLCRVSDVECKVEWTNFFFYNNYCKLYNYINYSKLCH